MNGSVPNFFFPPWHRTSTALLLLLLFPSEILDETFVPWPVRTNIPPPPPPTPFPPPPPFYFFFSFQLSLHDRFSILSKKKKEKKKRFSSILCPEIIQKSNETKQKKKKKTKMKKRKKKNKNEIFFFFFRFPILNALLSFEKWKRFDGWKKEKKGKEEE